MKILQVGPVPPEIGGKTVGGVATHLWDLSKSLSDRGHKLSILSDNFYCIKRGPLIKQGINIYGPSLFFVLKLPFLIFQHLNIILKFYTHFKGLLSIEKIIFGLLYYKHVLNTVKPDIIHVHHLEKRFPFAYFASKGKIPIITTVHSTHSFKCSTSEKNRKNCNLVAKNLGLNPDLIFVSKHLKDQYTESFNNCGAKNYIINNPVDINKYSLLDKTESREKINLAKGVPSVLFVGNLIKRKGIHVFIAAINILVTRNKEINAHILGDGLEMTCVKEFISSNRLEGRVHLEGKKTYPDILLYYNASDLLVLPSLSEGFALTYLEAMACGLPCIGVNGVADEIITSAEYGLLVPPDNPAILANAIESEIQKEWNRKIIRDYALSFSWDKRIYLFEELYDKLLFKNT